MIEITYHRMFGLEQRYKSDLSDKYCIEDNQLTFI